MMTMAEIMKIVNNGEYNYYGLRADDEDIYEIGETCENSHEWWQDDPEDDDMEYNDSMGCWDGGELDGTCAIEINEFNSERALGLSKNYCYSFSTLYLIAGDNAENGNDAGEIIIKNATVLAKVKVANK